MATSLTSSLVRIRKRVLRIEYRYEDFELGQNVTNVSYVDGVDDLPEYFQDILLDNKIMDVFNHPTCRNNPSFKIKTVELTESMYNKIFKVSKYGKQNSR